MSRRRALLLQAAGGDFDPLSDITWITAAWASDPSWTPPADGDLDGIGTWPGHGTDGADFVQSSPAAGSGRVVYRASYANLNNRPAIELSGSGVDRDFPTAVFAAPTSGDVSVVLIIRVDAVNTARWVEEDDATNAILGAASGNWRWFVSGGNATSTGPAQAVGAALVAGVSAATDKLYVNGTTVTGSTQAATALSGLSVGGSKNSGGFAADGAIAFVGVYAGDVLLDSSWSSFVDWAEDYYGGTFS